MNWQLYKSETISRSPIKSSLGLNKENKRCPGDVFKILCYVFYSGFFSRPALTFNIHLQWIMFQHHISKESIKDTPIKTVNVIYRGAIKPGCRPGRESIGQNQSLRLLPYIFPASPALYEVRSLQKRTEED